MTMSEWTRERLDMAKSEPKRGAPWEVVGMGPARHVRTVEGKLLVMGPVNASPLDLEHAVRAVNEREDMLAEIERLTGEVARLKKLEEREIQAFWNGVL